MYYRRKKPVYVYADYNIAGNGKSALGVKIFVLAFMALFLAFFTGFCAITNGHFPKKLSTDYNTNIVIEDNLGVIDDEDALRDSLSKFYYKTGITPAVITNTNEVWDGKYKDIEKYAYDEYINRFHDEKHWLIVYTCTVKDDGFTDWYWEGMQGDDTDPILGLKETDRFNKNLHTFFLQDNKYSVGEAISKAFDDLTPVVMRKYTSPAIKWVLLFDVIFLGFIAMTVGFSPKRDIYYPRAQAVTQEIVKEETCEYCGGVYVIGMHTKCPFCKAPVKPHDFVKDEEGKVIKIIE